jgi:hypothetical protein
VVEQMEVQERQEALPHLARIVQQLVVAVAQLNQEEVHIPVLVVLVQVEILI